jgi:hypothetical protein
MHRSHELYHISSVRFSSMTLTPFTEDEHRHFRHFKVAQYMFGLIILLEINLDVFDFSETPALSKQLRANRVFDLKVRTPRKESSCPDYAF